MRFILQSLFLSAVLIIWDVDVSFLRFLVGAFVLAFAIVFLEDQPTK